MVPLMCCPDHMMVKLMQWHYMTATPMPVASCDANVETVASYDKKFQLISIDLT